MVQAEPSRGLGCARLGEVLLAWREGCWRGCVLGRAYGVTSGTVIRGVTSATLEGPCLLCTEVRVF